jgi:hypothetical protein
MDVRGGVKMRMAAALAAIGYIGAVMTCADGAESMSRAAPADRLNEFRSTLLGPPWQKQKFALQWAMSALGQKRTLAVHKPMSALPPIATAKADIRWCRHSGAVCDARQASSRPTKQPLTDGGAPEIPDLLLKD